MNRRDLLKFGVASALIAALPKSKLNNIWVFEPKDVKKITLDDGYQSEVVDGAHLVFENGYEITIPLNKYGEHSHNDIINYVKNNPTEDFYTTLIFAETGYKIYFGSFKVKDSYLLV